MKKFLILLGVTAVVFGMSSCKKECNCTTTYGGTSVTQDWGEQKASDCDDLTSVYKANLGSAYTVKCSND